MALKKVAPQLPKGFKAVTSGGGNSVEWKPGMIVTGNVVEIKTIDKKNPKKGEEPTTRLMRIKTSDGAEVTVWEKAALRGLFDIAKKGKAVFIQHVGMGKAKKGQSAPNLFVTGIK
jgi:hypothetical protein